MFEESPILVPAKARTWVFGRSQCDLQVGLL
jgi:hypothetical protein